LYQGLEDLESSSKIERRDVSGRVEDAQEVVSLICSEKIPNKKQTTKIQTLWQQVLITLPSFVNGASFFSLPIYRPFTACPFTRAHKPDESGSYMVAFL
jgi:hypothetical protein